MSRHASHRPSLTRRLLTAGLVGGIATSLFGLAVKLGPDRSILRPAEPLPTVSEMSAPPSHPGTFGPGKARVGTDVYPIGTWRTSAPRPDACRWQALDRRNITIASGSVGPADVTTVRIDRSWEWFESRGCGWWEYVR